MLSLPLWPGAMVRRQAGKHHFGVMLIVCLWRRYNVKGPSGFYLEHGTWAFAVRKWLGGVKFWLIKQVASALGYTSLARKVWAGWQVRVLCSAHRPRFLTAQVHCNLPGLPCEADHRTPAPPGLSACSVGLPGVQADVLVSHQIASAMRLAGPLVP